MADQLLTRRNVITAVGAAGLASMAGSLPAQESKQEEPKFKASVISGEQFRKEHPNPVLFSFQPQCFSLLKDPEDLRTWEKALKERVGLHVGIDLGSLSESCCESGCPTNDCDTD